MLGLDYSFARPGGAAIKAAGYEFVCRYLASSAGKAITKAEALDLQANGLALVLVFEDYANQALNGQAQGVADAQEALAQANALGFPADRPIYFAVDFDATKAQQAPIDAYLQGAASVIGAARVGIYGGFYVVKRCLDNGTAVWAWQTVAWSGGQVDPRTHIYQNGDSAFAGGADVDEAKQLDYGQWPEGGDVSTPTDEETARIMGFSILGLDGEGLGAQKRLNAATGEADGVLAPYIGRPLIDVMREFWASQQGDDFRNKEIPAVYNLAEQANQPPQPSPGPTPNPIPDPTPTPAPKPPKAPRQGPFWDFLRAIGLNV